MSAVKDGGSFREMTGLNVKDGGSWREITSGNIKDGGSWREFLLLVPVEFQCPCRNYFSVSGKLCSYRIFNL